MNKKRIMRKLETYKNNIKEKEIELLYSRKCKKLHIDINLVTAITERDIFDLRPLIKESKTVEDFTKKIKENNVFSTDDLFLTHSLLMGMHTHQYKYYPYMYFSKEEIENILKNNIQVDEFKNIVNIYGDSIYKYIISDNTLKNQIRIRKIGRDLTVDFTKNDFDILIHSLWENSAASEEAIVVTNILMQLCASHTRDELFSQQDFVKFELENYAFSDRDYEKNKKERIMEFQKWKGQKQITIEKMKNIPILEKRIQDMSYQIKAELLTKLDAVKQETDLHKKEELLDDLYLDYEIKNRTDLLNQLYTPSTSKTLTNFKELQSVLIHRFIRNSKGMNPEETSIEESYLNDVLLNPAVPHKSLNTSYYYFDSSGIESYLSNTSSQLSTSVLSPLQILNQPTSYGIGFDRNGISEESIATISDYFITSNKGLYNLEVENDFDSLSCTYEDIKEGNLSEIVLHRNGMDFDSRASYMFVFLNGPNPSYQADILAKAKMEAEKNNLPIIIWDIPALKESYKSWEEKNSHTIEYSSRTK